jgi:hypothetical protein
VTGDRLVATLTGGELSLAALGAVELPAGQLSLTGQIGSDGAWAVPQAGVDFLPVEQVIDAPGLGQVRVKISIQATGPGSGNLPNGGGAASFNLPVQAKLEAYLGATALIGPEADCFLRPIQFSLSGTYDEGAMTASVASPAVTFPTVSAGCGFLGDTVNSLLELPRSDIGISLDFSLERTAAPPTGRARLARPVVRAPKQVRAGKPVTLRASVKNIGTLPASNVRVCFKATNRKLIRGRAQVCRTIARIDDGLTGSARHRFATRRSAKGKRVRFTVEVSYVPAEGGARVRTKTGHVSLLK